MFSREYGLQGLFNQISQERLRTIRPVITRGRQIENQIDWMALPIDSVDMIDPDSGAFFFTVGYSIVGGGDVLRP